MFASLPCLIFVGFLSMCIYMNVYNFVDTDIFFGCCWTFGTRNGSPFRALVGSSVYIVVGDLYIYIYINICIYIYTYIDHLARSMGSQRHAMEEPTRRSPTHRRKAQKDVVPGIQSLGLRGSARATAFAWTRVSVRYQQRVIHVLRFYTYYI